MLSLIDKGTNQRTSDLSNHEYDILANGYTGREVSSDYFTLLSSIRTQNVFLSCSCHGKAPYPPMLGTRMISNGQLTLVNLSGRVEHIPTCPFVYSKSHGQKNTRLELPKLIVEGESGRQDINLAFLWSLYPTLLINTELNKITAISPAGDEFFDVLLDGARLSPELIKAKVSTKIRFGLNKAIDTYKELRNATEDDYRILISLINGFDHRTIYHKSKDKEPFRIDAGEIHYCSSTSEGPFVATTIISRRGSAVFPISTCIYPCLGYKRPIPVTSGEVRELGEQLLAEGGLFRWLLDKGVSDLSFEVPVREIVSPLSEIKILPQAVIRSNRGTAVIASPLKRDREFYSELGQLIWHRSFSVIPGKRATEMKEIKSKISAVLLSL